MSAAWESPVLGRVSTGSRDLAEDVAADLRQLSSGVLEVARLHLEAPDCALAMNAPELLGVQLRWQQFRLVSAGAAVGPAEVALAVRSRPQPFLDEADLAITQLSLSLFYPRLLLNRTPTGRSLVPTSVDAEAHEIGIRMISDRLEQAGWRTTYLGADVSQSDAIEQVAQHRADVGAVSATMAGHIRGVRGLVATVRADPRYRRVRVLVGGRPLTLSPRLAAPVGADGGAPGAREAIELCHRWGEEMVGAA